MSATEHQHDPNVVAALNEIAKTKSERDAFRLDNEALRRQLAAGDARNQYLEKTLAIVQKQRDYYFGKVVELTTLVASMEGDFDKMRVAVAGVSKMREAEGPEPVAEEISDPALKPSATSTSVDDAAEARHQRTVRAFAPPRIRDAQQS